MSPPVFAARGIRARRRRPDQFAAREGVEQRLDRIVAARRCGSVWRAIVGAQAAFKLGAGVIFGPLLGWI